MKVDFSIDGVFYPALVIDGRIVLCLPQEKFKKTDACVVPYIYQLAKGALNENKT